jgi:hypothetical protein
MNSLARSKDWLVGQRPDISQPLACHSAYGLRFPAGGFCNPIIAGDLIHGLVRADIFPDAR